MKKLKEELNIILARIGYKVAADDEPEYIPNPFPQSEFQEPVYHGTTDKNFKKFRREPQGVYFTPQREWAKRNYGNYNDPDNDPIAVYVDVRDGFPLGQATDEQIGWFFELNYKKLAEWLPKLARQGYDHLVFGVDSDSFVVFGDVKIVNAITGESM